MIDGFLPSLQNKRHRDVVANFLHAHIVGLHFYSHSVASQVPGALQLQFKICRKQSIALSTTLNVTMDDILWKTMYLYDSEWKAIKKLGFEINNLFGNFNQLISHTLSLY